MAKKKSAPVNKHVIFSLLILCLLLFGVTVTTIQVQYQQKINSNAQSEPIAVAISSTSYSPQILYINPGTTVTWTNQSSSNIIHTTTSDLQSGPEVWDSGQLIAGQSYSHTFQTIGVYPYHDTVYPYINGIIVVTDVIPTPTLVSALTTAQPEAVVETILMENNQFIPQTFTVVPGTIVTWINNDSTNQSTTSMSQTAEESWDSGLLAPGKSYSRTFNTPGTYPYDSTSDLGITGSITVSSAARNPLITSTPSNGVTAAVTQGPTTSVTILPTVFNAVTDTPIPTSATLSPTSIIASPTPQAVATGNIQVKVSVQIPGIGVGGNVKPLHLTRPVQVNAFAVTNASNATGSGPAATGNGFLVYDGSRYFTGVINLGPLPNGVYYFIVHVPYTLSIMVTPQFQTIVSSQVNVLPPVTVIPGDIDNNDVLNIQDYNTFLSDILSCTDVQNCPELPIIDLNDDGVANVTDYNILLQSFATVQGE